MRPDKFGQRLIAASTRMRTVTFVDLCHPSVTCQQRLKHVDVGHNLTAANAAEGAIQSRRPLVLLMIAHRGWSDDEGIPASGRNGVEQRRKVGGGVLGLNARYVVLIRGVVDPEGGNDPAIAAHRQPWGALCVPAGKDVSTRLAADAEVIGRE